MIVILESILPVFLLIVLGNALRRAPLISAEGWRGLEQINYWLLYPALLFSTIMRADFSRLEIGAMLTALLATILIGAVLVLLTWPLWKRTGAATGGEFSSIFQTSLRWNGFIALAVAQKIFPPEGTAVVALAMAVIIIPLNVMSVAVVSRFGTRAADWGNVARSTATNPLILGVAAAIVLRLFVDALPGPIDEAAQLVASAAIGLGLISVGAGLRPRDMLSPRPALWFPVVVKLALLPALLCTLAYGLGVRGPEIAYLALCGAVPTAMNGYVLARQLGGDAAFYAAAATLQTVLAVLTMPVVMALAAQLSSG
jgi:malonate transporter